MIDLIFDMEEVTSSILVTPTILFNDLNSAYNCDIVGCFLQCTKQCTNILLLDYRIFKI